MCFLQGVLVFLLASIGTTVFAKGVPQDPLQCGDELDRRRQLHSVCHAPRHHTPGNFAIFNTVKQGACVNLVNNGQGAGSSRAADARPKDGWGVL